MVIFTLLLLIIFIGLLELFLKYLKNKNTIKVNNSTYYREIPCFGNIHWTYWLLFNFSNLKKNDLNSGLIGAYLLDWYKKGYIDITYSDKIGFKTPTCNIDLKDGQWTKNYAENEIYNFLKNVAGNNNILEKNEIKNYCSVDGNKFELQFLFKKILQKTQEELENINYISVIPSKNYILFRTQSKITLSDKLANEYQDLIGLKNFLLDFSNIEEKMHIEVHIWEEYLIFANLLTIADKVKAQFKKIYPDFNSIDSMFEFSFDNTFVGLLGRVNHTLKWQVVATIIALLFVLFIFFNTNNTNMQLFFNILKLFPIFIALSSLYWTLRKYIINKKVKEMNKKSYAKITKVTVHHDTEYDSETNSNITTTSYSFTYEYFVDGIPYTGYGHSKSRKKNGKNIKIYYNEMKPEKSETAEEHNHYLKTFKNLIIIYFIVAYLIIKFIIK